ncbi:MAG: hypothetical protein KDA80_05585 [Planctomycetaceae bacterium]|nr:hypothetical protein [Planctomycetaceae bacterium]
MSTCRLSVGDLASSGAQVDIKGNKSFFPRRKSLRDVDPNMELADNLEREAGQIEDNAHASSWATVRSIAGLFASKDSRHLRGEA